MTKLINLISRLGLAFLLQAMAGSAVFAQGIIGLAHSERALVFQGTGTEVINVVWQNCTNGGCTLGGTASSGDRARDVGTYSFSSSTPRPFKLIGSTARGLFSVDQSAEISFRYTCPLGTLVGLAHFTSVVQDQHSLVADLEGTVEVTGGSFEARFAPGPGGLNLTLTLGERRQNLATLVSSTQTFHGAIGDLSSLTPPSPCRAASVIASNFNGGSTPGGEYIWFNANFRATGIHNGTELKFLGGFVQFVANGNAYVLHVPNATINFSSSVSCASTSFDAGTDTWETSAPVNATGDIFLSGLAFPVPPAGLPGEVSAMSWSESFSSNTPDVSIQWKWESAVYLSFSGDYNLLRVKAASRNACLTNNSDDAGTPESFAKFAEKGRRNGAINPAGTWSDTVTARTNCP